MSLINDALKQARQAAPRTPPNSPPPPLQPARHESSPTAVWIVPAIIIFLVFAAIFFIGWAVAHRTVHDSMVSAPIDPDTTQQIEAVAAPAPAPAPVAPVPVPAPDLPKLQGIFYSPTAPSAILDGKTVSPGDQFKQYKVKAISKYTVILIDADKKEYTVGMGD